jgi:hypothetical protein
MYFDADAFSIVFAVGDLHGDVDVAMTLFCDIMQVVAWDMRDNSKGSWRWVARTPTCVVICGDVVDRSRHKGMGGPVFGENCHQSALPDDLFLLHLLNHWSSLATAAGSQHWATPPPHIQTFELWPSAVHSALIRLIGNHEVFAYTDYASTHSKQLLYDKVERHGGFNMDIHHNHRLSFMTPGAVYWNAIWNKGMVCLWLQIGATLFVHAGLTDAAVRALHPHDKAFATLRMWVSNPDRSRLPRGLRDALETRTLDANNPQAGILTRKLLNAWSHIAMRTTTTLIVGHSVQSIPGTKIYCGVLHHMRLVMRRPRDASSLTKFWAFVDTWERRSIAESQWFPVQDTLQPHQKTKKMVHEVTDKGSWITSAADAEGRISLFRIDVGQSRAWRTVNNNWVCWPHALRIIPNTNHTATISTNCPIPL